MKTALRLALMLILALAGSLAAAQDAYNVRVGDTLRIEVIEDSSLNRDVLVSPDGRISVPLAGSIRAAGRPVEAIQADLANALASNFATPPSVFVAVASVVAPRASGPAAAPATIAVFALGEVGHPGKIEVAPGTTVLQFFAQMGGFTGFAATKRVQLRRTAANGALSTYHLDYDAILSGQSPNGAVTMQEGDVIIVPQRRLFE